MMLLARVATAFLMSTVIAGCGTTTVDAAKTESTITKAVQNQVGANVKAVTCPKDRTAQQGAKFRCRVVGSDGSRGDALVNQQDGDGKLQISAPFLHVREIENLIAKELSQERNDAVVKVRCPEIVVAAAGGAFACQSTQGTGTTAIDVVQKDAKGSITYEVAGSPIS